jgi:hypothetical protein
MPKRKKEKTAHLGKTAHREEADREEMKADRAEGPRLQELQKKGRNRQKLLSLLQPLPKRLPRLKPPLSFPSSQKLPHQLW